MADKPDRVPYGPIIDALLNACGRATHTIMPPGWSFVVMLVEHNTQPSNVLCTSDLIDTDIVKVLREMADKIENSETFKPGGPVH